MIKLDTKVAIIGAGTAGLAAYRAAREFTQEVLLIEEGVYGTTCARVGCMPSKLLIAAAENAHQLTKSRDFGVEVEGPIRINGKKVMERIRKERDRFVGFVLESVDNIPQVNKILGKARFRDAHTLQVGQHTRIHADRIVIATGSRAVIPPPFESLGDHLMINDDVFDWTDLPESIAVFGPGVIGLEIAQALHRLGVRVLMFGRGGGLGPLSDPLVRNYAHQLFTQEFTLEPDAIIEKMELEQGRVFLRYQGKQGVTLETHVDCVLAAMGRKPNVDLLGLDDLGLKRDARGVPVANPKTMQTSLPHIFIAGDASNQLPLLHEAADQGKIAGANAGRFPAVKPGLRRTALGIVFTAPQIATIGKNYATLVDEYGDCDCFGIGEVSFEDQGRSRVMLKNKGLLRVYAQQGTGLFLGAEMIGPDAEHLAHLLAWAHQQQMTVSQMLEMPFYHPVVEEGLRTALRDLNAKLKLGPEMIKHCLDCGPGC